MGKDNDSKQLIRTNSDYICLKRYRNSISILLERYPEGVPDHIIAEALGLTPQELEVEETKIIACLRAKMGL